MNNKIIRTCDKCKKEDSINSVSGLCVSCEDKEEQKEFKKLQEENEGLREILENIAFINNMEEKELVEFWISINDLIENEIQQEKFCNQ